MQKQSKWIKFEVTIGYILLISLLVYSALFVYQEMEQLAEPDAYEEEMETKRKLLNSTLAQLYEAEAIGQSLSIGNLSDYSAYRKSMRKASALIDSLRHLASDSLQWQRMDSISWLLSRKEQNMLGLLKALNDTTLDHAYQQNVQQIIERQDSVVKQDRVQKKVVVKQDSYQMPQEKKGFFKRLAEAFMPRKRDTATVTNTSHEIITDTLTFEYNPADTVVSILRSIQIEINDKQQKRVKMLQAKAARLRYDSQILTSQINQILRDFEQEEINRSLARMEQVQLIRKESMQTIGIIAIGSTVLALVFLILIWRDITKSNRYRRELEKAKQKAEDLLKTRERLMLAITHDLKAPVGSIIGYIDLLERLLSDERQLNYLHNIKRSSEHLLNLVKSLLDYHKLDSNKMEINALPFSPKQLFDEINASFIPIAQKKQLEFHYKITPALNGNLCKGDPFRIRQIVDNLVSNAIKFTSKGNVSLTVNHSEGQLIILVGDTGKGIAKEEQEKIFQEFTRLKNAQGEEGFGLGLAIVHKLVALLKGQITVNSTIGKGSLFTVCLPLPTAARKEETDKEPPATIAPLNILLIDDDRLQLDLTAAMLEQLNAHATCCQHPDELMEKMKRQKFDILLTDVQMPAIDGFTLVKCLKESGNDDIANVPVVAVTARSDMEEADFQSKGFITCLHKPFSLEELKDALLKACPQCRLSMPDQKTGTSFARNGNTLNFHALTAFSEGDAQAANEILKTFIQETESNNHALQEALLAKNAIRITALAHKILPLMRMIHAEECTSALAWLETNRTSPFTDDMKQQAQAAILHIEKVIKEGKTLLE